MPPSRAIVTPGHNMYNNTYTYFGSSKTAYFNVTAYTQSKPGATPQKDKITSFYA